MAPLHSLSSHDSCSVDGTARTQNRQARNGIRGGQSRTLWPRPELGTKVNTHTRRWFVPGQVFFLVKRSTQERWAWFNNAQSQITVFSGRLTNAASLQFVFSILAGQLYGLEGRHSPPATNSLERQGSCRDQCYPRGQWVQFHSSDS